MRSARHHELATPSPISLRILQLDFVESTVNVKAFINDPHKQDLDVLLIHEPSVTAYRTHVHHRLWHLVATHLHRRGYPEAKPDLYSREDVDLGQPTNSTRPPRREGDEVLNWRS